MKKADRLFQLVTLLQGRHTAVTAQDIGASLGVTVRTVYRDIQALVVSGVAIDGEAGVGYMLRRQSHVPPLMFSADEVLAMLVGSHLVQAFTDPELAVAAQRADQKILAVLPSSLQKRAEQSPYRIPVLEKDRLLRDRHAVIRVACEQKQKLTISYEDESGTTSTRVILPLGIVGLLGKWLLLAWCEMRGNYRTFRFDRVKSLALCADHFETCSTLSLNHYFAQLMKSE